VSEQATQTPVSLDRVISGKPEVVLPRLYVDEYSLVFIAVPREHPHSVVVKDSDGHVLASIEPGHSNSFSAEREVLPGGDYNAGRFGELGKGQVKAHWRRNRD
jgi:hypothetical protein